jgi:hypothetical protein
MGEAGPIGETGHHVVQPYPRQDRHSVPLRLAMSGDGVAALVQLVAEQCGEYVVGQLRLL